jgi:hypothetical protein
VLLVELGYANVVKVLLKFAEHAPGSFTATAPEPVGARPAPEPYE